MSRVVCTLSFIIIFFSCNTVVARDVIDSADLFLINPETEVTPVIVTSSTAIEYSPTVVRKEKNPTLAAVLSAVLPGAGQVYTGNWWKVPIIYAGGAGFYYLWYTNNKEYQIYKTEYAIRVGADTLHSVNPKLSVFTTDNVRAIKNYYQRNIEMVWIFSGLWYVLNILDAVVFAHLYTFDVSDDLTMQIKPTFSPHLAYNSFLPAYAGVSLKFTFK